MICFPFIKSDISSLPFIAVLLSMIPFAIYGQPVITAPTSQSGFAGWVPGRLVVHFDSSVVRQMDISAAAGNGVTGIGRLDVPGRDLGVRSLKRQFPGARRRYYRGRPVDLSGWFRVEFSNSVPLEPARELYARLAGVLEVQLIGIHSMDVIPNDFRFDQQWHLAQSGDHDIDAPEAWESYTGNPDIIVGVLDSGVRYYHKDLGGSAASYSQPENAQGNMWRNSGEVAGGMSNGIDDDGNGYIDDWIGWDFVDGVTGGNLSGEDYDTQDNDPSDFNGHGTHCAGNVAAITNNGYGTAAVAGGWGDGTLQNTAYGVRVMALRIGYSLLNMGQERGYVRMDFAAQAIQYAADNGARIISCSWGSSNSGGIAAAIDYFLAGGGLMFKSAGNSGTSTSDYICGRDDANIISVAATDSFDVKADFSNYGDWVDISAPGVDIVSSYHVHDDPANDYSATISGTSMATPIAAGTAALIWGVNPLLGAGPIRQILYDGTDNIDGLNPLYAGLLGVGRVNAYAPLQDSSLPVELGPLIARRDSGAVILEWETFSELHNLGFEVYRAKGEDTGAQLIASYTDHPALLGLGNSSTGRRYRYTDREAAPGSLYRYWLHDVDHSGGHTVHGPAEIDMRQMEPVGSMRSHADAGYLLMNNYPNPFNFSTTIRFTLPRPAYTRIKIYDLHGREVAVLIADHMDKGDHSCTFSPDDLASGLYFYQLETGTYLRISKMLLVK